jgi:hypothetical protein
MSERMGDVVSQLRSDIRENGWRPGRGDYGADNSSDLVELIEEHNCVKGCTLAGTLAERREFGPGGNCSILMRVATADTNDPIRELDPRREGPHCTARVEPPEPSPRTPRRSRPPSDTDTLF